MRQTGDDRERRQARQDGLGSARRRWAPPPSSLPSAWTLGAGHCARRVHVPQSTSPRGGAWPRLPAAPLVSHELTKARKSPPSGSSGTRSLNSSLRNGWPAFSPGIESLHFQDAERSPPSHPSQRPQAQTPAALSSARNGSGWRCRHRHSELQNSFEPHSFSNILPGSLRGVFSQFRGGQGFLTLPAAGQRQRSPGGKLKCPWRAA